MSCITPGITGMQTTIVSVVSFQASCLVAEILPAQAAVRLRLRCQVSKARHSASSSLSVPPADLQRIRS